MSRNPGSVEDIALPFDVVGFDVDGTLVQEPNDRTVWEVLNERFTGRADHNAERFALYRAGKLTYAEWVALDIGSWREAGAKREDLVAAFAPLRLVDGTREALETLTHAGYRLVVISGTLDLMLNTLLPDAPFDEIYANHVGFDDEGNISHWRATPFDMEGKAEGLRALALRRGVPLARCAYVGDSTNDVWIARVAGFVLAFNPKSSEFEEVADVTVRAGDLRAILPHFVESGR
jgi:HAD superfamily phosphoserine phosphatase-like hydrolase